MKRFSFFRPVVFKKNNTFVTRDLAKNWLKRLNFTKVGNKYVLKGAAPSGGNYATYFDEDGHFLYMEQTVWSRAAEMMLSWPKFSIAHTKQYIDKTGAVWNVLRRYEVTKVVNRSNVPTITRKHVFAELQRQGISIPEDYQVSLTDKMYTSYLGAGKRATVHKHYDGERWVRLNSPSCGMFLEMPSEHISYWLG